MPNMPVADTPAAVVMHEAPPPQEITPALAELSDRKMFKIKIGTTNNFIRDFGFSFGG
jgi:hypothetical protein